MIKAAESRFFSAPIPLINAKWAFYRLIENIRQRNKRNPDLTLIRNIARSAGYAIAVHGSQIRDFDLIAVPWTDEAVGNWELTNRLCVGLKAILIDGPFLKPHGRRAVLLQMNDSRFKSIDLSIVAREIQKTGQEDS